MKKTIFFALAAVLLANYSCVEDRGNYDYTDPTAFYIDTVGMTADLTRRVRQFEQLEINPNLVFEGDENQLQHTWLMYKNASEQKAEPVAEQYDGGPTLSMPMGFPADDYYLQYVAYDPVSDRSAQMRWRVILTGGVGPGWLVYYRKDGLADCDLIRSSLLNANVVEDEVERKIYSRQNSDKPITTEPLVCGVFSSGVSNWITLMWEGGGARLLPETMELDDDLAAYTLEGAPITNPTSYVSRFNGTTMYNMELMINDGKAYLGDGIFNGPLPVLDGSSYRATHALVSSWGPNRIFYDNENLRFLVNPYSAGTLTTFNANSEEYFDFEKVDKVMIAMDHGFGPEVSGLASTGYGVMRDPVDNGNRYLYIWQMTSSLPAYYSQSGVLDISEAPSISDAEFFAFGSRGAVMLYAGGDKIGQVMYDDTTTPWSYLDSDEVWAAPAGEVITCMKFMKHPGVDLEVRADDRYLFVATWNAATSEGKVHVLETNVTSGELTDQPVATYSGFGRIKDMCYKVQ